MNGPLSRLSSLFRNLVRRTRVERDLDDELSAYLDALVAEKIAAGVAPEQAQRQARLELGGREQVKEQVRAIRTGAWVETAIQDLRLGIRQIRHAPAFTLVVMLTLGVGIGASAAVYALADALFLRPPPGIDADRLVYVSQTIQGRSDAYPLSFADYTYFRDHSQSFLDLAAHYSGSPLHFVHEGEPAAIFGGVVTHNYFATLGLTPALGRFFSRDEDRPPGSAVAVLGYDFWERRFGSDPRVIGTTIRLNDEAFTVIGVAPRTFQSERQGQVTLSVWMPSAMFRTGYRYCDAFERGCAIVSLTGRLHPGVTPATAQGELDVLSRQLETAYPKTNTGRGVRVEAARGVAPDLQAQSQPTVRLLASMVAVVLVISCANVAGLLFVRGVARRREVALRLALGAGRYRVIRQFLTESLVLAVLGGASGLAVALWMRHLLIAFYGVTYAGAALAFDLDVTLAMLAFTFGLSLLTGLVFGVLPAFQASGLQLGSTTNLDGLRAAPARSRLRDALVVVQVALSIVLLVGAGLMVRSVRNIHHGPGFDPRQLVSMRLRPSLIDYDVTRAWAFQDEVNKTLAAVPGVVAVSSAVFPPLPNWGRASALWLPGQEPVDRSRAFTTFLNSVGPDYFKTLGLPIVEGRPFTDRDDHLSPPVAIVNQTLSRHFWRGERVTGRAVIVDGTRVEVIGVTRDAEYRDISEAPKPFLYLSYFQQDRAARFNGDSRTHVRVTGDAAAMLPVLRRAIAAVDSKVPLSEDLLLSDRVDYHFRHVRAVSTMLVTLGAIGALLSAVALYAVLSLVVRQRRREIAIRMALGARRATVSRMVVRQGFALCAAGAGLGLITAVPATQLLRSVLFGVTPEDPSIWMTVACLLALVVGLACYLPARHAARVPPTEALKAE